MYVHSTVGLVQAHTGNMYVSSYTEAYILNHNKTIQLHIKIYLGHIWLTFIKLLSKTINLFSSNLFAEHTH